MEKEEHAHQRWGRKTGREINRRRWLASKSKKEEQGPQKEETMNEKI